MTALSAFLTPQMQALLQISKHEVVHVNYTYKQMNRETVTTRRLRPPR